MKVKRIPFDEFKKIYSTVPRLCVEVVLIRDKKILLTKRTIPPCSGEWHTPGGTVLKGENLHQAVKRVAKEEIGITVEIIKFAGVIEYKVTSEHYSQDISLVYLVKQKDNKKIKLDNDANMYDFFSDFPKDTIYGQKMYYSKAFGIKML